MLARLWVENFAIVDRVELALAPGFNVLTGETGAGKSILIDAIVTVLGERADTANVRTGAESLRATAEFLPPARPGLAAALADLVGGAEDEALILDRVVTSAGRSVCRINGRPATVSMLKALGELLVDIHGQHEHQSLLRPGTHIDFLDAHAGEPVLTMRQRFGEHCRVLRALSERREALRRNERELRQREDLLRFQVHEIGDAELSVDEERELLDRRSRLANAEKLHDAVTAAHAGLDSNEDAAAGSIARALQSVREAARVDASLAEWVETLEGAGIAIEEAARALATYRDGIEFDPREVDVCEARLKRMGELKRKYGDTVGQVLEFLEHAEGELSEIEHADQALAALDAEIEDLTKAMSDLAARLSDARQKAAKGLARDVLSHLGALSLEHAQFLVEIAHADDSDGLVYNGAGRAYSATGIDRVQFLISNNPGEPPRPLARIASGGEISRTMLALKSAAATAEQVPVVIFDEIDTGLGGRAAQVVGEYLARLSTRCQVICVTHSPLIAAFAHAQHAIRKEEARGRAHVRAETLDDAHRVAELERMLGGTGDGKASEHARELYERGRTLREQLAAGK